MQPRTSTGFRLHALVLLIFATATLWLPLSRAVAYGCGPSPEVGQPEDVPNERGDTPTRMPVRTRSSMPTVRR
jgi:hypothetical protein